MQCTTFATRSAAETKVSYERSIGRRAYILALSADCFEVRVLGA